MKFPCMLLTSRRPETKNGTLGAPKRRFGFHKETLGIHVDELLMRIGFVKNVA